MTRTRVKICGVTRPEDALAAARAGADAVGMVFHPTSRRHVSPERARAILDALPPFVTPVGLFVDETAEHVLSVARSLHLRHVQLHGDEPPERVAQLRELRVVKALFVERDTFADVLARWRDAIDRLQLTNLVGFVLETARTGVPGGSGVANDWETVEQLKRDGAFDQTPAIIAAGGLRPETVADVIRRARPWAADVSSGVDESVGVKSPEKMAAFVRAVREADGD